MLKKQLLNLFLVIVLFNGCACMFVEPKSEHAVDIFNKSLGQITVIGDQTADQIDLVKDKDVLSGIIKDLDSVIEEKKGYDKASSTISLIEAEKGLLVLWMGRIDTGNKEDVISFLKLQYEHIKEHMKNLYDNETKNDCK